MSIWHKTPDVDQFNGSRRDNTILEQLDIRITEVGADYIKGTMPADGRTHQPYGIVHGGANVVLAETLGSVAANYAIDSEKYLALGQEVSATHLRPVAKGLVTGTAKPVHIGRRSQVWEIRLENDDGKLTCISKLVMAIVER